eukprot:g6666.t1
MGPPGGGKGTVSKRICAEFDAVHVSTGDVLRDNVDRGTELGRTAQAHMAAGDLVPDALMVDLVLAELRTCAEGPCEHVLLDGFPRTAAQAEALQAKGVAVDLVLNLAVPTEEIVARISGRWVHPASGRVYADDFNPPAVPGKDDETGEPLIQREDDTPEAVRIRLAAYDEFTAPLSEFYRAASDAKAAGINQGRQGRPRAIDDQLRTFQEFSGKEYPELVKQNRRSDAIWAEMVPVLTKQFGKIPFELPPIGEDKAACTAPE